jgi:hypothetical protein
VSTRHPFEAGVVAFTLAEPSEMRQMLAGRAYGNNLLTNARWAGI